MRMPIKNCAMKMTKMLSALLLVGFLIWPVLFGGVGANAGSGASLQVRPESYDFGEVKRLGGQVQTTFVIHYQGDAPLKIRRIWTS
jgi:hypothetical protein